MAKGKNKKRNITKRQQRSGRKKKIKRKLRLVKLTGDQQRTTVVERPALSEMAPPEGFRTISMSQAMMEYVRPLMEKTEYDEDQQGVYQIGMLLWNYSLAKQAGERDAKLAATEKEILKNLETTLKMDRASAGDFLGMMVTRYNHLFPDEIQPRGTPFTFIRKEVGYLIRPIEEDRIRLSHDPVAPDDQENLLFEDLRRLDGLVDQGAGWDDIEELLWSIKDTFEDAFRNWLLAKGLNDRRADEFAACLFIWFDFIYAYGHDEETRLDGVPETSWLEFFHDFLLRKMVMDPPLYVHWPPALRLFYRYLHERGYLENPQAAERFIRRIEPDFYDLLQKQFA
ncbi:MAG: hypothetical protein JJV98_09395 [Desulfosarcina sp.]|nr:hypothetical protein [Desulfobacterales bacterium]